MRLARRIGLPGIVSCVVAALVASAALAGDSLVTPTPLTYGAQVTESTTSYNTDFGEQNTSAPFNQTCGTSHGVGVARTAWFSVQGTGGSVTVTTAGSDFDTALFVYAGAPGGSVVGCNDDEGGTVQSAVTFNSTAGATYAIQAGSACSVAEPCAGVNGGTLKVLATAVSVTPPPSGGAGSGGSPPVGSAPPAPNTSIVSKPRAKTTSPSARIGFSSTTAAASFQCSVDGGGYSACVSPRLVHVGLGPHIFRVRALVSGVVDSSPATVAWKVVKRKKPRHRHGSSHSRPNLASA